MAVLPILITGSPVLHTPARDVTLFDDTLARLVADMFETMALAPGVGLAAPQVGVGLRVFVYNYVDDDDTLWRGVAINPTLLIEPVHVSPADDEADSEGCLSVPGERYPLNRSARAVLSAVDLNGVQTEITATGWLARIFQHEFDHLGGVLYVDRLEHLHGKLARREIRKNSWGVPDLSWTPGVDDLES